MGLPNTHSWQTAKQFVINQYNTFEEAVRYLQSVETTFKESQPDNATANIARGNNRGRGSTRSRGRGRGQGQGRGRGKGRGNYQGQGHEQRTDEGPLSPDQCSWCLKEGHWKRGCRQYQKARARARASAKKESTSDTEGITCFASADDPSYSTNAYTANAFLSEIDNKD